MLEVCELDPKTQKLCEFISGTGGSGGKLLLSDESGDKSRYTSLLEKELLNIEFIGSIQFTVSSEVFDSEKSTVKYFTLFSVFYTLVLI